MFTVNFYSRFAFLFKKHKKAFRCAKENIKRLWKGKALIRS